VRLEKFNEALQQSLRAGPGQRRRL
ncbi:MAG: hypothetical protein AVDCRST_MAG95-2761, partial [uncultured Adhaeribacter sp.]